MALLGRAPSTGRPAPRRFRVGFDGHALESPAGGVRRYVTELFAAMAQLDAAPELFALGAGPSLLLPAGVTAVPGPPHLPTNLGWTLSGLPFAVRRASLDLYHAPAYTAPLWGVRPTVLTIHDVSYARHPEWYPYRRDPLRRLFYRLSAASAAAIITDSEFSRDEIAAAYGIDPDAISVIPLGVGAPFLGAIEAPPADVDFAPYLLHVGDLHPRRNLAVALEATLDLRRRSPRWAGLRLRLVGVDRGSGVALIKMAAEAGQVGALELLGRVDEARLLLLYQRALALVYPSRYEGFGLPLLEAMASGAPVVASRAGSIPEVLGPAGIQVEPDDVPGFVEAVERIGTDTAFASGLKEAGRLRARQFTWRRTAEQTLEVYRRFRVPGPGRPQ